MNLKTLPYKGLQEFLSRFNISESLFISDYQDWLFNNTEKNFFDFMEFYFQKIVSRLVNEVTTELHLYQNLRDLFLFAISFSIEQNQPANHLKKEAEYYSLLSAKATGYKMMVSIIG